MSTITIIGAGNMATAIGTRAAESGHTVEIMSRNPAHAQATADRIGNGAVAGTYGSVPAGDIVVLAVLHQAALDVVAHYGAGLAGKVLVDITNPFNADGTGILTTEGHSMTQQIAAAVPDGTHVIKAFNTIFGHVLAEGGPHDVLFAGDSPEARARFAELVTSLGMRPLDTGGLESTYVLEWTAILLMGLARNGAGWNVALRADVG
ncbi:hypothetical protein SAMN04487968_109131 [Nocardioides terrae]|uniref:Pyrroline-5-carboxylate reductase catalytic N-terminal domain-containing protein n=1 Tax=Nocardioides terrae TaxID=574651 RepID=A0A1I1LDJ2_9ACTN|nr:NAD(P)-binding domain-containing protein [Nocardioides terrae]SFC67600.1 hypothetical protein SAMN04487968_109131 [Nocardioides terrae]